MSSTLADIEHSSSPKTDVHIELSEHPSLHLKMKTNYPAVTISPTICTKRGTHQYEKLRQNWSSENVTTL